MLLRAPPQRAAKLNHPTNDRLQLLLNLTNRITSNLDLHELLRASAGTIRELMNCDYVGLALPTCDSGRAPM